jgi:hypothetical protein
MLIETRGCDSSQLFHNKAFLHSIESNLKTTNGII